MQRRQSFKHMKREEASAIRKINDQAPLLWLDTLTRWEGLSFQLFLEQCRR